MPYPFLNSPIKTGCLELPNRTVVAALTNNFGEPDGFASEQHIAYYRARGAGGWGAVCTEGVASSRRGRGFVGQLDAWDDRYIPSLRRVSHAIKSGGARAIMQVMHCGRQTTSAIAGGTPIAPSPVVHHRYGEVPEEMSVKDIADEVERYAQAVRRARDAGFDGAELHGAHGYLIGNFLSPISNQRQDAYGGDLQGRTRFLVEIIRRCRELVGDFPLWLRLSVEEYVDGGITVEEACRIAQIAEDAGIDALHASAGVVGYGYHPSPPAGTGDGVYIHLAEALKRAVRVPVIAVGRILTPAQAEEVLAAGKADLVALGRASIADPCWASKALSGEEDRIIPCVGCNVCNGRSRRPQMVCLTNPVIGMESVWEIRGLGEVRKMAVIGSGVGGLAAACAAAERGIEVTLYNTSPVFGGFMGLRALTPLQGDLRSALEYWRRQLIRWKVRIEHCLQDDNLARIADSVDAAVVAVAPKPEADIPSLRLSGTRYYSAVDILHEKEIPRRLAVLGGGLMGAETACYLAARGTHVTVVQPDGRIAGDAAPAIRILLAEAFETLGVKVTTELPDESLDGLVIPGGGGVDDRIVMDLRYEGLRVLPLGDAYEPDIAAELVRRGAQFGSTI